MSRIVRRDMLKAMAATAAGAAVAGTGIESVLAAGHAPGRGLLASAPTSTPKIVVPPPTAFTTYQSFPGTEFHSQFSSDTWSNTLPGKVLNSGHGYFTRLQLPQGAVVTECEFYFINPTSFGITITCAIVESQPALGTNSIFGSANPIAIHPSLFTQPVVVTPKTVDNHSHSYGLVFDATTSLDNTLGGARVGWLKEPGLTLFPDPRRIVSGDSTPFVSGGLYGPFDATLKSDHATPTGIPVGATAAFCAVQSYTPGTLTVYADGSTDPHVANYSGTGDLGRSLNMVYMMVPLSVLAKFRIHSYITGRCYVDAWGYVV
jgi:hypothetical protein